MALHAMSFSSRCRMLAMVGEGEGQRIPGKGRVNAVRANGAAAVQFLQNCQTQASLLSRVSAYRL